MAFLVIIVFHSSIYIAWMICTTFIIALAIAFLFRYAGGKWKSMRVVEINPLE